MEILVGLGDFQPYCKQLPDPVITMPLINRRKRRWFQRSKLLFPFYKPKQLNYFVVVHPINVFDKSGNYLFTIPAGFKTDLASIPGIIRWRHNPVGATILAAIVHDYLYRTVTQAWRGRKWADDFFLEIMAATNVEKQERLEVYYGVRAGGWASYQKQSKRKRTKPKQKSIKLKKVA